MRYNPSGVFKKVVEFKSDIKEIDKLPVNYRVAYKKAFVKALKVDSILNDIKNSIPGSDYFVRIKRPERVAKKIFDKPKIGDILGAMFVVQKQNDISKAFDNIKNNFKIVEEKNYFEKPNEWGYRGINLKVKDADGFVHEIQIHTPKTREAALKAHGLYEKWRRFDKIKKDKIQEFENDLRKARKLFESAVQEQQGKKEKQSAKEQVFEKYTERVNKLESEKAKLEQLAFDNSELENQYQRFKKLITPKVLQEIEDSTQLKNKIKNKEIDNILYSGEKSNDEVFDMFKERRLAEIGAKKEMTKLKSEIKDIRKEYTKHAKKAKISEEKKKIRDNIINRIKAREGTAMAVKQEIVNYAKEYLSLHERGKLLATVKNAKTFKDLDKARAYIEALSEKATERVLIKKIQQEAKKTKTRGKKPKGKYTPEVQRTLDVIRDIVTLNQKNASLKLEANLKKYLDKAPPPEVAMENYILSLYTGNVQKKSELLKVIRGLKEKGEIAAALKKFNIQTELERLKGLVVDKVTGGKGVAEARLKGEPVKKTAKEKIKQYLKAIGKKTILDWRGLMTASEFNSSIKGKSLADVFSVRKNENKYKELQSQYVNDFETAVSSIYKIKNKPNAIYRKVHEISTEKIKVDKYEMTRDELIKRYMEIQDPTLKESFIEGNGYTEKTFEAIKNKISAEDKKFAEWQLKYYRKIYDLVNEVYSKMNGVDLPFNEFYSPIRRVGFQADIGMGEFLEEAVYRKAVTNKSLISRVKNLNPIARQGSISALDRHVTDMNYYVAWAEKIRELDSVFSDNKVREAYKQEFPDSLLEAIENKIRHISTHGNKTASRIGWVDYIRKNYVLGNLAIKPALTIKQLVSTLAYLEKISAKDLAVGIMDFAKNPIKNYETLKKESAFIKTRGAGMERDIRDAIKEGVFDRYKKKQTFINNLLLNVRLGDKGAIILGSWALRKKRLAEGKNMQDIIAEYEEFSQDTQQSADISRLSEIQLGGSIEKLFTVFKSSQRAYLQKEVNAVKTLFRKDGFTLENTKKVAKVLFIYHVLLPVVFQWVANMGGWDDDDIKDYKMAAWLGSFNGLFVAGDIIDGIIRQVMGMRTWDTEVLVADIGDDINKIISSLTLSEAEKERGEEITTEDFKNALDGFASAGTAVSGLPVEYSCDAIESLVEQNYKDGIKQLLGWSEYYIKSKKKKSDKKLDRIFGIESKSKSRSKKSLDKIFKLK